MAKKKIITVQGAEIALITGSSDDYISLTDIDTKFEGKGRHIENWFRNQNTVEYLGTWELLHNPNFNSMQLHGIKEQAGLNRFLMSAKKWISATNAIGIKAKAGRYGGTFAHPDIAFHFCLWLSPTFQLYIAKEFQKLKIREAEQQHDRLEWSLKRALSKVNYKIHTDAIKEKLIPQRITAQKSGGFIYANEADILNVALFGMTAKVWRANNPKFKGNIRDFASTEQLLVLANLEAINAELIRAGLSQDERIARLNEAAISQMKSLLSLPNLPELPGGHID